MLNLSDVLQKVKLASENVPNDSWIDGVLNDSRPRQTAKSKEELKDNLENEFLSPSTSFSTYWLNEFQERWRPQTNYAELFQIAPTQTRTLVRFKREGLEGRVTGYNEVTVPASSATAKNSTSILRKPANRAEFVRGAAGFFPFTPGGLDGVEAVAAIEDQELQLSYSGQLSKPSGLERVINVGTEGGLLEIAPGLSRGMKSKILTKEDEIDASEVQKALEEEPEPAQTVKMDDTNDIVGEAEIIQEDEDDTEEEDIDALLPIEFPSLEPHGDLPISRERRGRKEWAHMVDVNREITNFRELVPDMAREWPFELDTFQKEAVYHLENGDSVFVAAHTSAGKTVVAEYAIALAAKHMTKAIYTSPIKALSNQKFRDFRNTFDDVGILTGDVQIRPEASCLIMTTEILRSMLYRGADLIRDVEFVIFDEVHYVNDLERGVVWEEVIIMLPEHVTLILLSATVPNTKEFASWVGRTKKKDIYVISTLKRPVPLEHYLWADKEMYKIVNAEKQFIENGWKDANDVLSGKNKVQGTFRREEQVSNRGGVNLRDNINRGNQRGNSRSGPHRGGPQRGTLQHQSRGRGLPSHSGRGNIARTGRGGGRTSAQQDRNIWVLLVQHLRKAELLPACIFVFSKKRCEENADALSNLDFCTAAEKSAIHMTVERSVARLRPDDRTLPQILKLRELLSRGFAVHHGGMLPILKEVVEILFAKALVKVLFATETFAMGLNLPTRTVVFSGYRKHDGRSFRDLLPGEYTQMAGRAGRRGLDTVGTVIIVTPGADEAPPTVRLRQMMLGDPTKLRSQFRLTYNMILNLLRVEALKIEEMIKRSFSEDATQALLPEHEKGVKLGEAELEKIKREPCPICDIDLETCHTACIEYAKLNAELHAKLVKNPYGRRIFVPKRLIVFREDGIRKVGMIYQDVFTRGNEPTVPVMILSSNTKRSDGDVFPYLAEFVSHFVPLPQSFADISWTNALIPASAVECVTRTIINYDRPLKQLNDKKKSRKLAEDEILPLCKSWNYGDWEEFDWSKIRDMSIRNILDERSKQAQIISKSKCLSCPRFFHHFSQQHAEWLVKDEIARLRQLMSDQNLRLLPDYEQRIEVLKELGFIDENMRVELKGKVACEVSPSYTVYAHFFHAEC
jgi:antiviral helicase SKI2